MTFLEDDGTEVKVEAELGATLLEVAHENDIELEGDCYKGRIEVPSVARTHGFSRPMATAVPAHQPQERKDETRVRMLI